MELEFADGHIYKLDTTFNYDQRLSLVNEIIERYENSFNIYWERKGESQKHTVEVTLDILGSYLFYASTKELNDDSGILTQRQMHRRSGDVEIPVGLFDEKTEKFLQSFEENYKKQNPKKSIQKYNKCKMHKLETIFIERDKRVNKLVEKNPLLYKIFIDKSNDVGNQIIVEESDFSEVIAINCFTKSDLKLPYINRNLPYTGKWYSVNEVDEFNFNHNTYKLFYDYQYDQILILQQNGNTYHLDGDINVIDSSKIKLV